MTASDPDSARDPISEIEAAKAVIDTVTPQLAQVSLAAEPLLESEPANQIERDAASSVTGSIQDVYYQLKEASASLARAMEIVDQLNRSRASQENAPPPPPSTEPGN